MIRLILMGFALILASPCMVSADEACDVARTVAGKAAASFEKDQAGGLKLFIKAAELCPGDPRYAYNLGMAYYRYGRLPEAELRLVQAVKMDGNRPEWRNNLASLLLERGGDASLALAHAEAASQALRSDWRVQDTLAKARVAKGEWLAALKGLYEVQLSVQDPALTAAYKELLEHYLSHYLAMIGEGKVDAGVNGLATADFEPRVVKTHMLALVRMGKPEDALQASGKALRLFPSDSSIIGASEEVATIAALDLYRMFKSGKGALAVQRAKKLAEEYPSQKALKEAYEKLLEALLADASTIAVPDRVATAGTETAAGGAADKLLSSLGHVQSTSIDTNLNVDVDTKVPEGEKAGPYDIAVVIGNKNYAASGSPNVDFAERDARTMRQYLIKTLGIDSQNIIYEENAPFSKFREIFGSENDPKGKLYKYVKEGISRVFIYYVGHGAPDLETNDAYLVPVDANPQYLKNSGYRLQTLYDNIGFIPAKRITVVLDSCFSGNSEKGMLFKNISPALVKVKKEFRGPANATVITSAGADQVAAWYPEKRHSLFTYFFLKGISGEADESGDGKITVGELKKYLANMVPYTARRVSGTEQQPVVSGDDGDVLVVLRKLER